MAVGGRAGTGLRCRACGDASQNAYITNGTSDNVSVVDTTTNTVTATIPVGSSPFGVAVSPNGSKVYVGHDTLAGTVSVIDTATNTVTAEIPVGGAYGVAVTPDGSKVYITNGDVSVIDTASNTVTATIPTGAGNRGVAVSPDGSKVYVTNLGGIVQVIAAATNALTATIPTGNGNELFGGLAVSPDGSEVYAAGGNSRNVSVIDPARSTVTTITLGPNPIGVSFTPDGSKVYVTITDANTVLVINTATTTVTAQISVGSTPAAFGIFIQPATAQKFAGVSGQSNCRGKSVSALAVKYDGIKGAAESLGYPSVAALQDAITTFCGG